MRGPCVAEGCPYERVWDCPVGLCRPHQCLLEQGWWARVPFGCSARTRDGYHCRHEGDHELEGSFGLVWLCDLHANKVDDYQRREKDRKREEAVEERERNRLAKAGRDRLNSVVYFVERDTFIKIGTTVQLTRRLAALSKGGNMPEGMTVGPVRLLATLPGTDHNEHYLHRRFATWRIPRTEWFYPSDDLWSFIRGLKGFVAAASLKAA